MVHQTNGILQSNGTYINSTASHVGQVFFDQDLISEIDQVSPYAGNTQAITNNTEDSILESVWGTFDPVMQYALLGDTVADGILAWSTIVINSTESNTIEAAAHYYEGGGVAVEGNSMGGGSGAGGGMGGVNGTMPSGMPVGSGVNASASQSKVNTVSGASATAANDATAASVSASTGTANKRFSVPREFRPIPWSTRAERNANIQAC